ncbi:sulfotransferase domain-containing protein [Congregibacter variabilis]|uniref:Sulfotransferase domain-containing protein n=1 Tax=Congregibacter variabilis TaxID=3081200 RepID=A0ABZ0I1G2_9GAMM|nr:sulfotransferase domain-containing protein [Congregibacter sp. IMCC43200]
MDGPFPQVTRTYQNHHLDSTRWEEYEPRSTDIIVTTSYKAGTTWTQQILDEMFYGKMTPRPEFNDVTPWPDARFLPIPREQLGPYMEAIPGRRFIKSHLPLDGLPYYPQVQYFIVARDARDVFMSFYNHYSRYTDTAMSMMNAPDVVGDPLPPCPQDPRELWQGWMTRGWFDWESEGYPFWANLGHTASYWAHRHLPNFHFFHYSDMLRDHAGVVSRMAEAAQFDITPEDLERIVTNTTFDHVKSKAKEMDAKGDPRGVVFKDGAEGFFFKGTNGRWKEVLTDEDLQLYEQAKKKVLTPDCIKWLEEGGQVG